MNADCLEDARGEHRIRDSRKNQGTAEHYAENDRNHREAFDPAVSHNEFIRGEEFREDAVFGGGVSRGAKTDDRVGEKRVAPEKHKETAHRFQRVREEHDAAFRHAVRKNSYIRRKDDVAQREAESQERSHPGRGGELGEQRDGSDEESVIGEA